MITNIGTADRAIRVLAGLGLIAFGMYDHGTWRWLALAGIVLFLTGVLRFCPVYWLLRISTIAGRTPRPPSAHRSV